MSQTPEPPRGEHFEEAIARWHLQVQTEVKRSSSLPTAMFDACDPSLETHLAHATEGFFDLLLEHRPPVSEERLGEPHLHLETVTGRELQTLVAVLGADDRDPAPAPEELDSSEHLAVLVDLCHAGDPSPRRAAALRLRNELGVDGSDLGRLTGELAGSLRRGLVDLDADDAARIERVCLEIAGLVAGLLADDAEAGPRP